MHRCMHTVPDIIQFPFPIYRAKMLSSVCVLLVFVATASAQDLPPSLWKWPQSNMSVKSTGPPDNSKNAEYNGISSCGGGGDSNMSWACPHLMLLSPDMQFAAEADGYGSWAVYGVAGIGQASDCGKCFQLGITNGNAPSKSHFIVQAVNTGSDVSSGQFDILIGAGGFGIYDGCSSDCKSRHCSGGPCNSGQFSGKFDDWTPGGNCYGGGVHDANKCDSLASSQGNFAEKTLVYGCKAAINQGYHQNFNLKFAQVQCPKSLFHVTGIRTANDSSLPLPSPSLSLPGNGQGTTTMDCCKPTCAWRQNVVGTDSNWPSLYVCSRDGMPLTI